MSMRLLWALRALAMTEKEAPGNDTIIVFRDTARNSGDKKRYRRVISVWLKYKPVL